MFVETLVKDFVILVMNVTGDLLLKHVKFELCNVMIEFDDYYFFKKSSSFFLKKYRFKSIFGLLFFLSIFQ